MCKDALQLINTLALAVLLLLAGQLKDIALKILLEVGG
jgi:hypothetical protein